MEHCPENPQLMRFNDYFVDQWLENDAIGDSWNCYKQKHRTTNSLEAWHSKLNRTIGKHHPNVLELVKFLKEDAIDAGFNKQRADLHLTPSKRRRKCYKNLDCAIVEMVNDFTEGRKTVAECLNKLQYIVKFE